MEKNGMTEDRSFYAFLGKIDAFNGQYIEGMMRLLDKMDIQKEPEYRVLEVGAATGFTSSYVAKEYGCHVTSTDISGELVERGRQDQPEEPSHRLRDRRGGNLPR